MNDELERLANMRDELLELSEWDCMPKRKLCEVANNIVNYGGLTGGLREELEYIKLDLEEALEGLESFLGGAA